jgi:hypothetical protein
MVSLSPLANFLSHLASFLLIPILYVNGADLLNDLQQILLEQTHYLIIRFQTSLVAAAEHSQGGSHFNLCWAQLILEFCPGISFKHKHHEYV